MTTYIHPDELMARAALQRKSDAERWAQRLSNRSLLLRYVNQGDYTETPEEHEAVLAEVFRRNTTDTQPTFQRMYRRWINTGNI